MPTTLKNHYRRSVSIIAPPLRGESMVDAKGVQPPALEDTRIPGKWAPDCAPGGIRQPRGIGASRYSKAFPVSLAQELRIHLSVQRIEAAVDLGGAFAVARMAPCFPGFVKIATVVAAPPKAVVMPAAVASEAT
jgi:hypothetical protein